MSDPLSPLLDFYPNDFVVDANGKKNAWECVVCIPFIQEDILVDTVSTIDHQQQLTLLERQRNALGVVHRYPPTYGHNATSEEAKEEFRRRGVDLKDNLAWGNALNSDTPQQLSQPARRNYLPKEHGLRPFKNAKRF